MANKTRTMFKKHPFPTVPYPMCCMYGHSILGRRVSNHHDETVSSHLYKQAVVAACVARRVVQQKNAKTRNVAKLGRVAERQLHAYRKPRRRSHERCPWRMQGRGILNSSAKRLKENGTDTGNHSAAHTNVAPGGCANSKTISTKHIGAELPCLLYVAGKRSGDEQ